VYVCYVPGRDDGKHDSGLEVVATTQCTRSRRRADNDDTRGMEEITKANKTTDTHLNSIFEEGLRSPEAREQNGVQTTNGKGGVGCMYFGWTKCIGLKARSGFEFCMRIIGSGTDKGGR
jgi:hypothetical protein